MIMFGYCPLPRLMKFKRYHPWLFLVVFHDSCRAPWLMGPHCHTTPTRVPNVHGKLLGIFWGMGVPSARGVPMNPMDGRISHGNHLIGGCRMNMHELWCMRGPMQGGGNNQQSDAIMCIKIYIYSFIYLWISNMLCVYIYICIYVYVCIYIYIHMFNQQYVGAMGI